MEEQSESAKKPYWCVTDVIPQKDYTLLITFEDGSKKIYDARELLQKKMYERLKNPGFFMKAKVQYSAVVWDDDTDIDL